MTISMDPHYTTVKLPDGGIRNAPSGVEFHFHGPVTLNYVVVTPAEAREMWDEEMGGEDEQSHHPDAGVAGPDVLSPLMCDTRALPATHPRNGGMWLMKDHPAYRAVRRAAAELEAAEREQDDEPEPEPEVEPVTDERALWQRLLRRPVAVAE